MPNTDKRKRNFRRRKKPNTDNEIIRDLPSNDSSKLVSQNHFVHLLQRVAATPSFQKSKQKIEVIVMK